MTIEDVSAEEVSGEGRRHEGLAALRRLVLDGAMSVLSFDVFDTLLWRRVPVPTDLFLVLGAELRSRGRLAAWVTDHGFRRLREDAEHRARHERHGLGTEVSLHEIWERMPLRCFGDAPVEELVAAEVDIERRYTVVDLATADLLHLARRQGMPIVLVSDTYFGEAHLATLLDRPELGPLDGVRIFRSNAYGTDKGSDLWPVVLNALGVYPEQVVHVGDNPVADVEAPAEFGIRTVSYERVDDAFAAVLEREHHEEGDDLGLTTLRARAAAAAGSDAHRVGTARRWGAGVLGPVLTGFAEFVAESAVARGVGVVWCPMREGELLSDLVNTAARARGLPVEARPLWLSREVAWMATVDRLDRPAVRDLVVRSFGATVRSVLRSLELSPGEVPALAPRLDDLIDDSSLLEEVADVLIETPYLRHRLATTAVAKRRRLVHALRRAGALDRPEMTLVDLGWGGTIQLRLAQALRLAAVDVTPTGLYLATDERALRVIGQGLRIEGFLGDVGRPDPVVGTMARSPEVVELSVNALCGSLYDFDEQGEPLLGPVADIGDQSGERRAVQAGVHDFQERWNSYVRGGAGSWPSLTTRTGRARLAEILRAALDAPTAPEASLFGSWSHEDNLGSDLSTRLLPPGILPAVPYLSVGDVAGLRQRDAFWPALVAAADPRLAAALRAVRAGQVPPETFEPSPDTASTALLMARTHDGRWQPCGEYPVRVNHHGLSYVRFSLRTAGLRHPLEDEESAGSSPPITDVSLALPGRPALVRIDRIEARLTAVGGATSTVSWTTPGDLGGLHMADAEWLGGNLVEFRGARSAVVLPVSRLAPGPLGRVELWSAFAMVPQSASGLTPPARGASTRARIAARMLEEYRVGGAPGVVAGAARFALRRTGQR